MIWFRCRIAFDCPWQVRAADEGADGERKNHEWEHKQFLGAQEEEAAVTKRLGVSARRAHREVVDALVAERYNHLVRKSA